MSEINLTNKNFEEEVFKSEKPVLVDFFATWCGPCQMLAPIIEEIEVEYRGRIKVGKINVIIKIKLLLICYGQSHNESCAFALLAFYGDFSSAEYYNTPGKGKPETVAGGFMG